VIGGATGRALLNTAGAYVNIFLMALITVLVVPIYARLLDAHEWGIVATCMTVHGALFAMDVVLGPLITREVAKAAFDGTVNEMRKRFQRIYVLCGALGVVVAEFLLLSGLWSDRVREDGHSHSLLIALQVAFALFLLQFSNAALIGFWSGVERLAFASGRTAMFTLLKHSMALACVALIDRSAMAYLSAFVAGAVIELVANLKAVSDGERERSTLRGDAIAQRSICAPSERIVGVEKSLKKSSAVLFVLASLLAVATGQVDRVLLSVLLPTQDFGAYYLITYLVAGLLSLQVPVSRSFLPQISASASPETFLRAMYRVSLWLLIAPCVLVAIFAQPILAAWMPPGSAIDAFVTPFRCMLIGVILIAAYSPIANYLFSRKRYHYLLAANAAALTVQTVVISSLTARFGGFQAGGLAWLACGLVFAGFALWTIWRLPELDHLRFARSKRE
jgi:O-antigen/teichoic acid export membrane protein